MKSLIIGFLFLWVGMSAHAQVFEDAYFRTEAEKSLNLVYNLEFEEAHESLSLLKEKYKRHPAPYFLLALNRWWQTYISENSPVYYAFIESHLKTALELNEAYEDKPEYLLEYTFFQYMTYAFKARFHILKKEYMKGANAGRKALPYLKDGFEFTDRAPEFFFSSGIYHYYAEAFPRAHPIVKPFTIFFPDGSIKEGLLEMEQAAVSFNFTQVESMFYLTDIYLHEVNRMEDGLKVAYSLIKKYPQNTWFRGDYARALVLNERYDEATRQIDELITGFENQPDHDKKVWVGSKTPYTTQLMINVYQCKGIIALKRDKQYTLAQDYFAKSNLMAKLSGIESNFLLPYTAYYQGVCFDQLYQRKKAVAAYKSALNMDESDRVKNNVRKCLDTPCLD